MSAHARSASGSSPSPSPSPHLRSASPTVLANMRRFRSRPSNSSLNSLHSAASPPCAAYTYKSAPAQPALSNSSPSPSAPLRRRASPPLASAADPDSDDEEYIRFPNGAFVDTLPPSADAAAPQLRGRASSLSNSVAAASPPRRTNSGRRTPRYYHHQYHVHPHGLPPSREHSPEVWEADGRRFAAGASSKFTTRASEAQRYYYGSGLASSVNSNGSSAEEYLAHFAASEAAKIKENKKRVRFSLPL